MDANRKFRQLVKKVPGARKVQRALLLRRHTFEMLQAVRQEQVLDNWGLRPDPLRNPLTARGRRYWSQANEDGILEQILIRTGPQTAGMFLEFGVGNGNENNTIALLARGWKGAWFGGEDLSFAPRPRGRLYFEKVWITRHNIVEMTERAMSALSESHIDVLSMDLDGNDFHLTKDLLEHGLRPTVWISEYNARFPVDSHWIMDYSDDHVWAGDDYYGASILSFVELFHEHGYFPVACSAQGSNVFMVQQEFRSHFNDVPTSLNEIYQPPAYALAPSSTHSPSPKTLESLT